MLATVAMLAGCSWSNRMSNYEARLIDHDGADIQVYNKRGALLQIEKPDGTKITADDRGLPEQPGFLSQLLSLVILDKATGD